MIIGCPTETKNSERRVGLTPTSAHELASGGHEVLVQSGAGLGIGADDDTYLSAGARIAPNAADVWDNAEMIVKVKEPQPPETAMLGTDQVLFTYLHLAADPELTQGLMSSGATCIAYETVTDSAGRLPLLAPMSQVAGRLSIQTGATALESTHGGAGILLGGVPGVEPARVVVIGGGVVGEHAIEMAVGLGARVTVLDRDPSALTRLAARFGPALTTVHSNSANLRRLVTDADLVVGAVLVPGATAPRLVTAKMISEMRTGSVVVDVAIDQGGCFETSHPTSHEHPTYVVDGVVHYCVANIPGAVPRTSAHALNNATLPHVMALANKGPDAAFGHDHHLAAGLNVADGKITNAQVAAAMEGQLDDPTLAA